jgi:ribonuclease BN (tRNA processing enzyme)
VISGDTAYAPELAQFAKGADVLIHEAMYLPGIEKLIKNAPDATKLRQHLLASHTSTEDVGRVAAQAGVKTLVLSHLVPATILRSRTSNGPRSAQTLQRPHRCRERLDGNLIDACHEPVDLV